MSIYKINTNWPWYIYSCLATIIVCLIFLGFWGAGKYMDSRAATNEQLEGCLNIATDFERNGNIELREYMRRQLDIKIAGHHNVYEAEFLVKDYNYVIQRRKELIREAYIHHFFDGTFKYHDKDGIGITLPSGYQDTIIKKGN